MALVVMSMVLLDWVPAGHAACLSALHESSTTNLASLPHSANKMVGGRLSAAAMAITILARFRRAQSKRCTQRVLLPMFYPWNLLINYFLKSDSLLAVRGFHTLE